MDDGSGARTPFAASWWWSWVEDPHFASFLGGIFLGQAFLIAFVLALVYLFLLREPSSATSRRSLSVKTVRTAGRQSVASIGRTPSAASPGDASLLESCEWLNAVVARVWAELRQSDVLLSYITHAVDEAFNPPGKPSFVGQIIVRDLTIGEVLPTIDGVSISVGDTGDLDLSVYFDVSYHGPLSIAIDTELVLNWPAQRLAALPVSLAVSLLGFAGKFRLHCPHPPEGAASVFSVALVAEPSVSLEVSSSLGAASKVRDLPKLRDILTARLYDGIARALVLPAHVTVPAIDGFLSALKRPQPTPTSNGEASAVAANGASGPNGTRDGLLVAPVDTESPLRQRWMGRVAASRAANGAAGAQ